MPKALAFAIPTGLLIDKLPAPGRASDADRGTRRVEASDNGLTAVSVKGMETLCSGRPGR